MVRKFITNETGATAIEYGLIAGLIATAIILGVTSLGTSIDSLYTSLGALLPLQPGG